MTRLIQNTTRPRPTRARRLEHAAVTSDLPQESFTAVGAADPSPRDRDATDAQHAGPELTDLGADDRVAVGRHHRTTSPSPMGPPMIGPM